MPDISANHVAQYTIPPAHEAVSFDNMSKVIYSTFRALMISAFKQSPH